MAMKPTMPPSTASMAHTPTNAPTGLRSTATADELAAHCASRIARFKIPVRFHAVSAFPQTASGKIRKAELREWANQGRLETLA